MLEKRSVYLAGHATSVALEPAFWAELERIAASRNVALNKLVGDIDKTRGNGDNNLASALRLFVLGTLKAEVK